MTDTKLDLEIVRFVAASREKVWRAWSDPDILKRWWCPKPWVTEVRAFDFRGGGAFYTFMSGPDGGESDNPGLFLEVVPMERIVWTSMLVAGWRPATPWLGMKHEDMGFFDGWGMGEVAQSLPEQGDRK